MLIQGAQQFGGQLVAVVITGKALMMCGGAGGILFGQFTEVGTKMQLL